FDPAAPDATARVRMIGRVLTAPSRDKVYTAKAALFGGRLQDDVPSAYIQPSCNNTLGDEICTLDLDALKATGVVAAIDAHVVDVTTAAANAAQYFGDGYAEFGSGEG